MRTTKTTVAVLAVTALFGLSACGSSDDSADADSSPSPEATSQSSASTPDETEELTEDEPTEEESAEEVVITISDFAYDGPPSVSPGATVTVTNEDAEVHTVTADDGSFDVNVAGGATETFTAPDEPGDYACICTFHRNMTGTLTVA